MKRTTKYLVQAAVIAALYAVLTHLQNLLLPGSATWAIQMRLSEALCVLAFVTNELSSENSCFKTLMATKRLSI